AKRIIDQQQQSTHQQQPPVAVADILIPRVHRRRDRPVSERLRLRLVRSSRIAAAGLRKLTSRNLRPGPPSPAECRYYATRMRASDCATGRCLATLDGHELILTPSGGRLAALPGIQKLQSLGQGHMLSPVRLGLADHYLFYGADLSAARPFGSRRETLPSLHPDVTSRRLGGGGGADVGGSGGFLGHTIVFPKKEEDQFKTTGRKPNGQPPTFCASSIRAGFCTAALLWPLCDCPRRHHRYAFSCQGLCSRAARR
uniref:Sema domain-containing protein n=1 Tax=Macrostomum lignano TaxID=282301 RepID=A0A1I8JQY6_9PLAT